MKKIIIVFIFAFVLSSCSYVVCPENGIYYCEALDMTWDFGGDYVTYTRDGVDYLLNAQVDRNGETIIRRYSDSVVVIEGTFAFENNVVTIKANSGTIYNFVLIQ